jgi:hypothetical protein
VNILERERVPRPTQNKLYKSFIKGLITEAGPLTYPENASTDELNTVIKVKGSRSRRLGLDFEPSSVASSVTGLDSSDMTSEFAWKGVGNDAEVNFLVVHVKRTLHFYNMDAIPITSDKKAFTVDLSTYVAPFATAADVDLAPVQMASGKGFLFVASPCIDPVVIEYDPDTDTISTLKIIIQVRDFDGIDDGLANEEQPTTLTKEHFYNLKNQGWVTPGLGGVVEGAGTTDPYTPPAAPTTTDPTYYNPRTGGDHTWEQEP